MGTRPDYAGAVLGGMLLIGIGFGLALPTLMATAASSLPPHQFATGSAVVNMVRQVGFAVGVALLVALVGTPATAESRLAAFHHGWAVSAAIACAGAAAVLLFRRRRSSAPTESPAQAALAIPAAAACPAVQA